MRFKDQRAQQQAVQKYGEAQLAFHMSRSQFALQLVTGQARGGFVGRVDAVAVFALADALAREDMRLRVAETKMLGEALGQASEIFDMPRVGEPFKVDGFAPKLVITSKEGR